MSKPRYAYTNLAWSSEEEELALEQLKLWGVTGIEIAPLRIWPDWGSVTVHAARDLAVRYQDQGFRIPAVQGILYGRPDAQLFGDDDGVSFESHLCQVAEIAAALNAKVCVLGAPRNRKKAEVDIKHAIDRAYRVMRRVATVFNNNGITLAIEAVRPDYGGDFLTTHSEVFDFVKLVDHPSIAGNVDAAAMHLAGESIENVWTLSDAGKKIAHYHASEPGLSGFSSIIAPQLHNLRFLDSAGWRGWRSFEILRGNQDFLSAGPWSILRAIN